MRAIWLREFGGPGSLIVGEAPDPVPGAGQVLIEVSHANITFVETQIRAGSFSPFPTELPTIPGNGVGGLVTSVGPGVHPDLVGRRVVSGTGGSGGYAERVVVPATSPLRVPDGLAMASAVALLADGRTALMLVDAAGLRPGERVLIEAAAGGVGTLLVQLARAAGATVIAAAGGSAKLALAGELGAEVLVDYRSADWPDRIRRAVDRVDVVFDGVGGQIGRAAFELLAPAGRMLSFGLASGEWAGIATERARERGVTLIRPTPGPAELRSLTQRALAEAAGGRLRPVIGQRFPLHRAADAHAAIESRSTVGKTLLETRSAAGQPGSEATAGR